MNKGLALGCGALALIALLAVIVFGQRNRLVELEEDVTRSWSQVENVYQRRADLIPNLVETVKGASEFERETFESVAQARASAGQINIEGAPSAEQLAQFQAAQGDLTQALSRLMVVVEKYPDLRATEAFRDLQSQLEGTENRITVERSKYNESAQRYNTAMRKVPMNLVASLFGFTGKPYFESEPGAETVPRVDFG